MHSSLYGNIKNKDPYIPLQVIKQLAIFIELSWFDLAKMKRGGARC